MADAPYIGSGLPAKVITADGATTLFQMAEIEMGDALAWWQIATLNGLDDYLPAAGTQIAIPQSGQPTNDGLPFQ